MGDSKAVAIGDDQMIFFKVGKTISKKQTISFDKDVSSVAVNDDYAAFVFEDQKKQIKKNMKQSYIIKQEEN